MAKNTQFYPLDGVIHGAYNPASRGDGVFVVLAILLFDIVFMKGCAGGGLASLA